VFGAAAGAAACDAGEWCARTWLAPSIQTYIHARITYMHTYICARLSKQVGTTSAADKVQSMRAVVYKCAKDEEDEEGVRAVGAGSAQGDIQYDAH